jgi:hypothetical protein
MPLFIFGCNMIAQQSPSEVVIAAYKAGNDGRYAETKKYFSSELLDGDYRTIASDSRDAWDRSTRDGTMERIEIIRENIRDTKATVLFVLYFRDGSKKRFDEPLIKEKGLWKFSL